MKINSVNEYIQKREILEQLNDYLDGYVRPVLLVDKFIYEKYKNKLDELNCPILFENTAYESDVVIGIGGGRIMDQAKKFAYDFDVDCILIPTSPATDAPCTNVFVSEKGYVECGCPKKVLVDETVLFGAPTRFLVSGIGDALSTYFESKYYELPTSMQALSKACYDTLMTYGVESVKNHKEGLLSEAFSKTIEAILYMSGIVYGNSGPSITHNLTSGFSQYTKNMHGEVVAFFLLVQLYLENDPRIHELREFYKQVGLPCHLNEIGLSDAENEDFDYIITTCPKNNHFKKILKNDDIIDAIRIVDAFE